MKKLSRNFYTRDVLEVAPDLLGKYFVVKNKSGLSYFMISEVEAYKGEEDLACHASKGRTKRTEVMYDIGGKLYVYFIYGMYWMLNIVTGDENNPQAVLIRGIEKCNGPGRLSKMLGIDRSFYGEDLVYSERIWIADPDNKVSYLTSPRINIDYSGELWSNKPWRFYIAQ